jgi:putative redox protein
VSEKTVLARQDGAQRFVVWTGSGHEVAMDDGPGDTGPRPTEAFLAALVACTAMDVASLLAKKRQAVTSYTVEGRGRQQEAYPHVYTWIEIVHVVEGLGIEDHAVRRSIELSATKYCPISAMVSAGPTEIHHRFRIRDSATEPAEVREAEVMVTGPNAAVAVGAPSQGVIA